MTSTVIIAEKFGPTLQGEGPSCGQQALFIRLSRCNLTCRWCDTPETWDWSRFDPREVATRQPVAQLAEWAMSKAAALVVITGGEPLLQHASVTELAGTLTSAGRRVEIETNGTIVPTSELTAAVTQFNVSPKLANSGVAHERRINPEALSAFARSGRAVFKFVAGVPSDLLEVDELADLLKPAPVWVMAEGTTGEAVVRRMRELSQPVIDRGWNLTPRLQVLLWEDERGR